MACFSVAHVLNAYVPLLKATPPRTFDAQDVLVPATPQDVALIAGVVLFILLFEHLLKGERWMYGGSK
ncbi:hypothetical protein DZB84_09165 [Bacillus sp. HNG]|nr:hypothetical protein DZB84_09165 [Bacillus sp. HNG]